MKNAMKICGVIGLILFNSVSNADYTGNDLINPLRKSINGEITNESGWAAGYVDGVAGTLILRLLICQPDSVTYGQVRRVVYDYLKEHSKRLHEPAVVLINNALYEAWSCPK